MPGSETPRTLVEMVLAEHRDCVADDCEWRRVAEAEAAHSTGLSVEGWKDRDAQMQQKVRDYAVALAIATRGDSSGALREAEAWLARLPTPEPGPDARQERPEWRVDGVCVWCQSPGAHERGCPTQVAQPEGEPR